jgi:hypothetical protein
MSKPHKLSVMEGGGAPVESAEEEYYLYLPFHPNTLKGFLKPL